MPTAAAATYVRTVLFLRRQSSCCARAKGLVLFGRHCSSTLGARAGLGRFHVPSRLSALSATPVPLHPGLGNRSLRSATLVKDPGRFQSQPRKAMHLHSRRQSPPITPRENARLSGTSVQISRALFISRYLP